MHAILAAFALTLAAAGPNTLYDDLGGEAGVSRIVADTIAIALEDERIAHTFAETNLERLQEKLELQFCELSGGPCAYDGLTMAESHQGLGLNSMHFNALVEVLQEAMRRSDVPFRTQNRLLALLAPMKRDVVEARSEG